MKELIKFKDLIKLLMGLNDIIKDLVKILMGLIYIIKNLIEEKIKFRSLIRVKLQKLEVSRTNLYN